MIQMRGMAWDHPRGYEPLIAASHQFSKLYPDVKIDWDVRTLKDFGDMPIEKLIQNYDLITIDHPYIGQANKNGLLLKLDRYLSKHVLDTLEEQSIGRCFDIYRCDDHVYALPIDAAALVSAYRQDILDEFGLSIPSTRDELKRFYRKVPRGLSVAWALCPTDIWCTFLTLCAQNAGSGFIAEYQIDAKVGICALDELKYHLDFLHPDSLNWNPIQILDRMGNEDQIVYSPFLFGYTNYARTGYTKHIVRFSNSPAGTQSNLSTILGGVGLAVSSQTQHCSIAAKFVEFVSSAEVQEGIYTENGGQPANMSAWQNSGNNLRCNNFFSNTIWTIQHAYIRPQHPGWNEFQERGAELIHTGILKNIDSEIIMRDLNMLYQSNKNNE